MVDVDKGGEQEPEADTPSEVVLPHIGQFHAEMHPVFDLFNDGYWDEAVRRASQRFINRVRESADHPDVDGVALMNKAFSSDKPLLVFSERLTATERNEHNGYRSLAVGLTQALRNVLSHHDDYGLDATQAWEWLVFISAMHRRLDQAAQAAADPQPQDVNA